MKYEVIDKVAAVAPARTGEVADLYTDLVTLMDEEPTKKLLVDFETVARGYKAQCRMAEWAAEDGLQLFASAQRGTGKREMYLQKVEAAA